MNVGISEKRAPVTERELEAAEGELRLSVPSQYRRFLLKHDGVSLESNFYDPQGPAEVASGDVGITRFFSIAEIIDKRAGVYHDRVPLYMLPIGEAEGGNLICLSLRVRDEGTIYFWDHEEEHEEGEGPGEQNLYKVAGSLQDLLEGLRPAAELDAEFPLEDEEAEVWIDPDFLEEQRRLGNVRDDSS